MSKKRDGLYLIFLFLFFCLICGSVCAGGNNTTSDYVIDENIPVPQSDDEIVYALENGHLNTSFSDGSKGYCIEYREQEASIGDKFYKTSTDYYESGKYLKTYFLRYYHHTQIDPVVTQHMIWHFTDGFEGWRLNYTIIDDVKSNPLDVPDTGLYRLNDTHSLQYTFNVLRSPYVEHQDYFTYIIKLVENNFFDDNDTIIDNGAGNSSSSDISLNETIINEEISIDEQSMENVIRGDDNLKQDSVNLKQYITGYNMNILAVTLMILIILLLVMNDYRKRKK